MYWGSVFVHTHSTINKNSTVKTSGTTTRNENRHSCLDHVKPYNCDGVSYDVVSFLIPNPQHTVSLYTFVYQESVCMVGRERIE
jgi:hypothetical protein